MKSNNHQNKNIPNILIVDDIGANLKLLDEILKSEGYKTRPVPNGRLALQVIEKEKPDLILLDIMMPEMDGFEVCRQLKENPDTSDIPIIFISALGETTDIVKALSLGAVDYINKPFQEEEVKARVKTHIILRRQSQKLIELNAEKDKFFSIIAHDMRSPFSAFLGLTNHLAEEFTELTMDEIHDIILSLQSSSRSLYCLLENLLEWSLIRQDLIPIKNEKILLLPVILECLELAYETARNKNISLVHDIQANIEVYANSDIIHTIFRNFITNAIKFTPNGGKINISANCSTNNIVQISIQDNGIGMEKFILDNLFRLDINTNRRGTNGEPSTGLGLNICKEFIERLGGKLWIKSDPEGKYDQRGTTIHFTVPGGIVQENTSKNEITHKQDTPKDLNQLKILIVDDDEASLLLFSLSMSSMAREIVKAKTGSEAIEACRNNPDIDLVMMDVKLPFFNGLEATSQIRKFNNKITIIAMTAFVLPCDIEKAIAVGCNDLVGKEIRIALLTEKIRRHFIK